MHETLPAPTAAGGGGGRAVRAGGMLATASVAEPPAAPHGPALMHARRTSALPPLPFLHCAASLTHLAVMVRQPEQPEAAAAVQSAVGGGAPQLRAAGQEARGRGSQPETQGNRVVVRPGAAGVAGVGQEASGVCVAARKRLRRSSTCPALAATRSACASRPAPLRRCTHPTHGTLCLPPPS